MLWNTVVEGDATAMLTALRDQGAEFDVAVCDPPYNIGIDFGNNRDRMPLEQYLGWSEEWINLALDLVVAGGIVYLYGRPEIAARIAARFPISEQRFLAWHYTNKTTPGLLFWQRSHETVLALWRGERPRLLVDQIREPYTPEHLAQGGTERTATPSRYANAPEESTVYQPHPGGALPRDVISIPALAGGAGRAERWFLCRDCGRRVFPPKLLRAHRGHDVLKHPTQKPQALTRRLLLSAVPDGTRGRLLVPFAGSGSECVAARSMGMDFAGIEVNPDFVEFARQWLAQTGQGMSAPAAESGETEAQAQQGVLI